MARQVSKLDLSGGMMAVTNHLLRKRNEVEYAKNFAFNIKIGSAVRRPGYEKVARTIEHGKDSLGFGIFRFGNNNKVITGINKSDDSFATLRVMDTKDYWTEILSNASPNTRFDLLNYLEELYVVGYSADYDTYMPMTNFDSTLVASTTRNVYAAPASKFLVELQGQLYAINCRVAGKTYKDRAYISSPPTGPVTFVQTDQSGLLKQLRVDSTQYIKVGMSFDIYGKGSEYKKVSNLTVVSVDKKNKRFSFADTSMNVGDNDELWLTGRKNKLSILWNTDDPTPEEADYITIPPSPDFDAEYTGATVNANRLLLYTRNSFMIWDGGSQNIVSKDIGCVSHQSIRNIGPWTIWLSHKGIYGYNVVTGQGPKLLSKAMQPYIQAINQSNFPKASAGVFGNVYKLAVGELLNINLATTSTSTSSTSTSSTSSSTSSTSTSSTSTSSTSTSTSQTTTSTSTSSTSTSTTSVSTSTSSTSSSTSTSSTSTSTVASTKKVIRFCYDFEMNAWWLEQHKREIRFQGTHTMHGYTKPYFTDETGRLFRDETGDYDNGETIPCEIKMGRDQLNFLQRKSFVTCMFDSEEAVGATLQYSIDGGDFKTLMQIQENIHTKDFPQSGQMLEGRDINYRITHNAKGRAPIINGPTTFYNIVESIPNAAGRA